MGWWADRAVPRLTDKALDNEQVNELRVATCQGLHGRVLEIGFGSGLNLPHLPPEVSVLHAVEPHDAGWDLSRARREHSRVRVERTGLDGQRLDDADASYDAVLSTFTLCTIPDAGAALREVRRVLKPGASLHFVEHGLAPDPGVVTWQRRLEPMQRRVFGGCHLTRDVPALLEASGLRITSLEQRYLPGPRVSRPWSYGYLGRATPA
jgi:SAM-dependent methyltransferase